MADENGSGRLDRIEEVLTRMIEHHEREFKQLLTWQVLMQDKMDKYWQYLQAEERMRKESDKALDERVDKLVSAIGASVERLPHLSCVPKSRGARKHNSLQ